MDILQELTTIYGYNTPIFANEVKINGMGSAGVRQALSRLSKNGKIERFAQGIYYIPTITPFGKSCLNAKSVYEKKYITDGKDIYGYYGGLVLENAVGLTTQMPNVIEIVTNRESSRLREVEIGNQRIQLRKSRTEITSDNAAILQFLDLINQIDMATFTGESRRYLLYYARLQELKKADIYKYIALYPSRVAQKMLESRIIDELM